MCDCLLPMKAYIVCVGRGELGSRQHVQLPLSAWTRLFAAPE